MVRCDACPAARDLPLEAFPCLGGEGASAHLNKPEILELLGGDGGALPLAMGVEGVGEFLGDLLGHFPLNLKTLHHVDNLAVLEEGDGGA